MDKQLRLLGYINTILVVILFFSSTFIILITSHQAGNIEVDFFFNESNAHSYLQDQLDLNTTHYRIPGTIGHEDCGDYFISKFQNISASIPSILHNFTVYSTKCQNILFKMNENKSNIIILGAHYDSRARATKDPDPLKRSDPVPGANDGASGCAALIELARILYPQRGSLNCQIWFLFFDAEDQGRDAGGYGMEGWDWCEGSKKFTQDLDNFHDVDKEHIECMILLDMIGGNNLQFIAEQHSTSSLLEELFNIGRSLGYTSEFPSIRTSSSIIDDHYYFVEKGIPSADLIINFWNNPYWPYHHTIKDDNITISSHSLGVTGKTIEQFIYNNYLMSASYQGNSPWFFDLPCPDSEILLILLSLSLIVIIALVIQHFYRLHVFKKTSELPR